MRKMRKWIVFTLAAALLLGTVSLIYDYVHLTDGVLRLHVVGASDLEADQTVKLAVRDNVLSYLRDGLENCADVSSAEQYVQAHLADIQAVAEQTLRSRGFSEPATVTLAEEAFPTRYYDTFSLPSGVYTSLRISIGEAKGQNWWCVIFPSLCLPATSDGFEAKAVSAGFSDGLSDTLSGEGRYEIRFFFLDCLGKLENFLRKG